ncbi:MAG TPA: QueT transporter family protein [Bacillota bacterium]|nr:QueT transporter family protein [Bacillota bacterium]
MNNNRHLVHAALIAAVYAVLTIAFAPLSYGQIQVRFAEALTILPFFTPAAIPGLFIGCIVANIFGPGGVPDVIFGSAASLISAYLSYKMPVKWLVPLPPVVVNGIIIGYLLKYLYQLPLFATMGWVALGELISCYFIGYPLLLLLEKYRDKIFI